MVIALANCAPKAAVEEAAPASTAAPTIDGVWATACISDNNTDSYIKSFQVQNGVLTIAKLFYFNTLVCDQSKLGATLMESGDLTITGDSAVLSGGKEYEWKLNMIAVTPNAASTVTMFNNASFCGSVSWVQDQAAVVFGCNSPSMLDLTQVAYQTIHYGVFSIDAAATPVSLQFETKCADAGYEEFCPTSNERPATLDATNYYKQ